MAVLPALKVLGNPIIRRMIFIFGWFSLAMGVIGIFLPLLPTTPFVLLAAACFARSSPKFYAWITSHPHFGPPIANYLAGNGLPLKAKLMAVGLLWVSVGFTSLILVSLIWAKVAMLVTALAVSIYILRLPTLKLDSTEE